MKHSWLVFFAVAVSSLAGAQPSASTPSREQLLEVFSRFNPSVLQKAEQNPVYQAALEQFLTTYAPASSETFLIEVIAVARNFDNSIDLKALTDAYHQMWLTAKMSGQDFSVLRRLFRQDVAKVMSRVWAVTVQLRQYQLDQAVSPQEKQALADEIKRLKKNPGEQVFQAAQDYVSRMEEAFRQEAFTVKPREERKPVAR